MVVAGASPSNAAAILDVLQGYCEMSGQAWNCSKSTFVISKKTPAELKAEIQATIGVHLDNSLGLSLGVPLPPGVPRLKHFGKLQARVASKIGSWKSKSLSLAGGICLINYSILPMFFHTLAHCRVPKGLLVWFEQLIRGFLWNHEAKKKWHYIGWSTFTADKHKGGAGIISVVDWYEALKRRQAKTQIPCGWWAEAVKEKYRFTSWIQPSKSSGLSLFWKAISTVGPRR